MTKSNVPFGGYSVNTYVGCPHACRYCYASFMKRFTGHTEEWGTFMDVKDWPEIANPRKYAGQKIVIGTVTDGYNPLEETYGKTRPLLEQLRDSGADILICTKSDLVLRNMDLLRKHRTIRVVGWRVNFSSDAIADFAGLLAVNQEICKRQMAEKAPPDVDARLCGDSLTEINKKNKMTVSWSVNTLDEGFKDDMDAAVSIERRLAAQLQRSFKPEEGL